MRLNKIIECKQRKQLIDRLIAHICCALFSDMLHSNTNQQIFLSIMILKIQFLIPGFVHDDWISVSQQLLKLSLFLRSFFKYWAVQDQVHQTGIPITSEESLTVSDQIRNVLTTHTTPETEMLTKLRTNNCVFFYFLMRIQNPVEYECRFYLCGLGIVNLLI